VKRRKERNERKFVSALWVLVSLSEDGFANLFSASELTLFLELLRSFSKFNHILFLI
jgi:hypothetical protein